MIPRGRTRAGAPGDDTPLGPMLAEPRRALGWAIALAVGALVLCLLVWNTTTRAVVQDVDDAWLDLMEELRWQPAVTFAEVLAFLGGSIVTWIVRGVVIGILLWQRRWLSLVAFVLAIVASEALIGPLKALYDRPRPPNPLTGVSGASFPSGHAVAGAVNAVGIVIVLLPPGHGRWTWERRAALYAFLMALSRTYLGAHWLSDVVAGALMGTAVALSSPALLVGLRTRRAARRGEVVDEE